MPTPPFTENDTKDPEFPFTTLGEAVSRVIEELARKIAPTE